MNNDINLENIEKNDRIVLRLINELLTDIIELNDFMNEKLKSKFKKEILNAIDYPYSPMPIYYTTKKGHKYLFVALAQKRGEWKAPHVYPLRCYNNMFFLLDAKNNSADIYTIDFLKSYQTTMMMNKECDILNSLRIFFFRNPTFRDIMPNDKWNYTARYEDGIVLGERGYNHKLLTCFMPLNLDKKQSLFKTSKDVKDKWNIILSSKR